MLDNGVTGAKTGESIVMEMERGTCSPRSRTRWCSTWPTEGGGSTYSPDSAEASQWQVKGRGEGDLVATVVVYQVFYKADYGRREHILHWPSWCISGASQGQGHKVRGEGDGVAIIYGFQVFNLNDWKGREIIVPS